jgi:hypothetical protein
MNLKQKRKRGENLRGTKQVYFKDGTFLYGKVSDAKFLEGIS